MTDIIESEELRKQLSERTEVLDKVKALFLIPGMEVMTTKQVADYFEVGIEAIQSLYKRNKDEIDSDGTIVKKPSDFGLSRQNNPINPKRGVTTFEMEDGTSLEINNAGSKCFSRRAILRIAMLLRDSEIAKEVRTQLLNVFENTDEETWVYSIEEEQDLWTEFGKALLTGTTEETIARICDIQTYHKRHITALETENQKLEEANQMLADGINTWDNHAVLNAMVRAASSYRYEGDFRKTWNTFYKRLSYNLGITLKNRSGEGRLVDKIKDEEWPIVLKTAAAWLTELHIDVEEVINTRNAELIRAM